MFWEIKLPSENRCQNGHKPDFDISMFLKILGGLKLLKTFIVQWGSTSGRRQPMLLGKNGQNSTLPPTS